MRHGISRDPNTASRLKQGIGDWFGSTAQTGTVTVLLVLILLLGGGFRIYTAGLAGIVLTIYLGWIAYRGELRVYGNWTAAAILSVLLGYGLSVLWAADRGMAGFGVVKFLPVALYAALLAQRPPEECRNIYRLVPWAGAVMTVLAAALQFVPGISGYVRIDGRLTGTFQYANTYALFLLIGCIELMFSTERTVPAAAAGFLLMLGIFASGSRTTFLLLLLVILVFCLRERHWRPICSVLGMLLCAALLSTAVSRLGLVKSDRYLTTASAPGTLYARLLYFKDALPVIARHPLGLGYLGYRAVESGIQNGVYSVRFVHNELLQLLLDVGWVPTALLSVALVRGIIHQRKLSLRLAVGAILVHAMMDFDLQFLSIWFLLIPCLELHGGRALVLPGGKAIAVAGVCCAGLCLWLGLGDVLYQYRFYDACLEVTPFHTEAMTKQMAEAQTVEELEMWANRILTVNPYKAPAHNAIGDRAMERGDLETMLDEKERAMELAPYYLSYYLDYFDKVHTMMERYSAMGDAAKAALCRERLLGLPARLEQVKAGTDPLAWKLQHKPELRLPAEYREKLKALAIQ